MPHRPGQKQIHVLGNIFFRRMKEYIDSDSCRTYCNLDLPVAKFKLEGYGEWKIKDMRTWLPSDTRDKPIDMV